MMFISFFLLHFQAFKPVFHSGLRETTFVMVTFFSMVESIGRTDQYVNEIMTGMMREIIDSVGKSRLGTI
jgi:hypothetical protein